VILTKDSSSNEGEAHANVGSFRDDEICFQNINDTGWSILAVSDGAGSASLSKKVQNVL
jgi:hypothetical protein